MGKKRTKGQGQQGEAHPEEPERAASAPGDRWQPGGLGHLTRVLPEASALHGGGVRLTACSEEQKKTHGLQHEGGDRGGLPRGATASKGRTPYNYRVAGGRSRRS